MILQTLQILYKQDDNAFNKIHQLRLRHKIWCWYYGHHNYILMHKLSWQFKWYHTEPCYTSCVFIMSCSLLNPDPIICAQRVCQSGFIPIFLRHDDVIKWKHFAPYRPFVRVIHRSSVDYLNQNQWRGALVFLCAPEKRLSKQSRRRWGAIGPHPLWRHYNGGSHTWVEPTLFLSMDM